MIRAGIAIALTFGASACAVHHLPATPILLRHPPPERGGPTVFPQASPSGTLDLSGACVGLQLGPGNSRIVISSHLARVGRDGRGNYLEYDGRRFRHGQWVKGGGGGYDQLPAEPLDAPVPAACSSGPFLILVNIRLFDPSTVPPPVSPLPPPGT